MLVAGTFGVLWTAPWKDDVERLTDDVQHRLDSARRTLGALDGTTGGDCTAVSQAAPGNVRDAVDTIAAEAKRHPDAKVPGATDRSADTVAEVAKRQAARIGDCIERLPRTGAGWAELRTRLERAVHGA